MLVMGTGQASIFLSEQNRQQIQVLMAHYGQVTIASLVRLLIQKEYERIVKMQSKEKQ